MGHAACEVMLESKASCEDDQKKQVWSADPLNQTWQSMFVQQTKSASRLLFLRRPTA